MRRIFGFLFVLAVLSCGVAQSMYSVSLMAHAERPWNSLSGLSAAWYPVYSLPIRGNAVFQGVFSSLAGVKKGSPHGGPFVI